MRGHVCAYVFCIPILHFTTLRIILLFRSMSIFRLHFTVLAIFNYFNPCQYFGCTSFLSFCETEQQRPFSILLSNISQPWQIQNVTVPLIRYYTVLVVVLINPMRFFRSCSLFISHLFIEHLSLSACRLTFPFYI